MFIDQVTLIFTAGQGGNGSVSWARRKYVPKGGPSGGNGGDGGSIILRADDQINSLEKLADIKEYRAEVGSSGGKEKSTGKTGIDLTVFVPCGVAVKDADSGELIADLIENEEEIVICQGGRGGRGNATFKSSTRRAPYLSTEGAKGESRRIYLELKSIADLGLVGMPNAGKSSLLNALTGANAEIGAYPFTTKFPNLGAIELPDHQRLIIADIPGIGMDAHKNRGLGLRFLRHIERTRSLIFVLDASGQEGRSPVEDYKLLNDELGFYSQALLELPRLIVLNKIDVTGGIDLIKEFKQSDIADQVPVLEISAKHKKGLAELKETIIAMRAQLQTRVFHKE